MGGLDAMERTVEDWLGLKGGGWRRGALCVCVSTLGVGVCSQQCVMNLRHLPKPKRSSDNVRLDALWKEYFILFPSLSPGKRGAGPGAPWTATRNTTGSSARHRVG